MGDSLNRHVKILFNFYSNILDKQTTETMWAEVVDSDKGLYKLDNIPFYVPLIACDDIVFAEYDETGKMLIYRNTIEYSGNSTIHVVIIDELIPINEIRDAFNTLGCESEGLGENYFALEIPVNVNYDVISQKLNELTDKGIIDYAESCISERHKL
jgi:hypothetical protein